MDGLEEFWQILLSDSLNGSLAVTKFAAQSLADHCAMLYLAEIRP